MTAGDVINELAPTNTTMTFQPAVGVNVMLLAGFANCTITISAGSHGISDGTIEAMLNEISTSANMLHQTLIITNDEFYKAISGAGGRTYLNGIEI